MESKLEFLKSILSTLSIPIAYNHFNKETKLPYLLYLEDSSNNTFADNKVYYENCSFNLELYTEIKDTTLENQLKTILTNNEIPYEKTYEDYLSDERMYEITYTIAI